MTAEIGRSLIILSISNSTVSSSPECHRVSSEHLAERSFDHLDYALEKTVCPRGSLRAVLLFYLLLCEETEHL